MDNERLGDENLTSTILNKQLERIKENKEIRDVNDESSETEFSAFCSSEAYDSENASIQFWRIAAERFADELDKIRMENLSLENSINSRMTRLNELRDLNAELLEEAQYLEMDEIESIPSSTT